MTVSTVSNYGTKGISFETSKETNHANPTALTAAKIAGAPLVLAKLSIEAAVLVPLSIVTVPVYRGLKRVFIDKTIAADYQKTKDNIHETSAEIAELNSKKPKGAIDANLAHHERKVKRLEQRKAELESKLAGLSSQFNSMSKAQSRLNKLRAWSYQRFFRDVLLLQAKPSTWGKFSKMMVGYGKSGNLNDQGIPLSYHKQVERAWKNFRTANPFA